MRGGAKVVIEPHRHSGVFIARGKEDSLVTRNMVPGVSVYNEKRISVEQEEGNKVEYRVWNPFRSKLAAAILAGLDNIYIKVRHREASHIGSGRGCRPWQARACRRRRAAACLWRRGASCAAMQAGAAAAVCQASRGPEAGQRK